MTHPWFSASPAPRVLAHRGFVPPDADGVVENTLAAFAAAHGAGAAYVESDCHVTSDGVVVLFHDDHLTRITGDPRPVADVRHAELSRIMADRGGLVTAAEALEAFPTLRFNLDVKAAAAALPLGRVIAPHADRVLVTSFSDSRRRTALEAAHRAGGRPATSAGQATIVWMLGAVASGSRALVRRALRGIDAVQVPERRGALRIVTPRLVRAAHVAGVEVHVWTVNDPAAMTRLLDLGVDGLVSDRADLALRAVAARR
ncbi:MAG: glycerophosphodiester phosphodiesterase [Microbacterium hominis]|uniref:glycerophosphodiester phosphodiesterase family protein n=1 Tax=Microbacterium aurum TaxID=36805 RepID=UPI00248ED3FB|nr:glycerophosphodiester phosphodiesterase family protein [Microbacterium aurum]MBZ6372977.1 glycerophosphodiester phosphodiesterase [Microbacterium hominis]